MTDQGVTLDTNAAPICACPLCAGLTLTPKADAAQAAPARTAYVADAVTGAYSSPLTMLDPSAPGSGLVETVASNGKPIWSAYETATHILRPGGTWGDYTVGLEVVYSFGDTATIGAGNEVFDSQDQVWARYIMALYADVCGLTFRQARDGEAADITFEWGAGSANGGGWANYPSSGGGRVHIGHVGWEATNELEPGTLGQNIVLHELGHAVGLAHPGPYNSSGFTYTDDADHWNDTNQFSNMSYWGASNSGGNFGSYATLALHDMLAVQIEYGANLTTRTGDTVYGYHATAGVLSYDLAAAASRGDSDIGFAIWDAGGNDTLDFSGSSSETGIDLRQGAFSSVNGATYNVAIAYGAVVENAVGSSQADYIRGNEVANRLSGGDGNDVLIGGAETAVADATDPRHFIGIEINPAPQTRNQYLVVAGVTAFSGAAFTFEEKVMITRIPSNAIEFASYNVSGNDNQFILEGNNDGYLGLTLAGKPAYLTSVLTRDLVDGNPHRLSVSFDKATGAVTLHVDGALAHSGIYTDAVGATIKTGGTLIIGQEQDSLGGGFDSHQVLQGTVGDIRIFNDVRATGEILGSINTALTGTEQGLVSNWQVSAGAGTTIANRVAGGAGLAVVNGGQVRDTKPVLAAAPDHDTLIGGGGRDVLFGGAGDDTLVGDLGSEVVVTGGAVALVRLNAQFDEATMGGGYSDHSLDQSAKFTMPGTAVTFEMEMRLSALPEWYDTLLAYSTGGEWDTQQFTLRAKGTNWELSVAGQSVDTGISLESFVTETAFRLSISWNSADGAWAIFRDGTQIAGGIVAAPANGVAQTLPANGNLWIASGWDDVVRGDFGDIRVWNHVRSESDIKADAFSHKSNPGQAAGLVANWQVNGSATLSEMTGNPSVSALSVQNVTAGNPVSYVTADFTILNDDKLRGGLGADHLNGGEGQDLLLGDATVLPTENAMAIRRLYLATLDRGPDDAGWEQWTAQLDGGTALPTIATGFVNSAEFQSRYGSLNNTGFVTLLYNNVLHRTPDSGGLAAWTTALANGMSRESVVMGFSESAEFKVTSDPEAHAGQVFRLYDAAFNRMPDVVGFSDWLGALDAGLGADAAANSFVTSAEFVNTYGALNNQQFVALLYTNILGRAGDAAGLNYWTGILAGGASRSSVLLGFSDSAENIASSRAAVAGFMKTVRPDWNDVIEGGQGNDRLTGDIGADTFVFARTAAGNDHVYRFEDWDTLKLTGFGYAAAADALAHMTQIGDNVVFVDQGETITFHASTMADMQRATYLFS